MRGRLIALLAGPALLLGLTHRAHGELPPNVYRQWQRNAPEALTIRVVNSQVNSTHQPGANPVANRPAVTVHHVRLRARVLAVERSRSGLRPDQVITIRYTSTWRAEPMPGPSQPPLLQAGNTRPAFLRWNANAGAYGLAAGGRSFNRVP